MAWIQAHWWQLLAAWSVVNAVASSVASQVPATGVLGRLLHIFVAISPMDVVKALKTMGAAAIPPVAALLLLVGCGSGHITPADSAIVAAEQGEQANCVYLYRPDASAIDSCRGAVRARFDGYWSGRFDGGQP